MKSLGFTLIELLVVLGTILLLATVVMTNYLQAVRHSQDAQRKTDLEKIRSSLVLYYSNNDFYPETLVAGTSLSDSNGNIYLETVPKDPNTGQPYEYQTNVERSCFWLKADLEDGSCYVVTGGSEVECPPDVCVFP